MQVELLVRGYPSKVRFAEWQAARSLPESELPQLTTDQKVRAEKLHISNRDFQVSLKTGELMAARATEQIENIARLIVDAVRKREPGGNLKSVLWDFYGNQFQFVVENEQGTHSLTVPPDVVDDVLLEKPGAEQKLRQDIDFIVGGWAE